MRKQMIWLLVALIVGSAAQTFASPMLMFFFGLLCGLLFPASEKRR